MANVEREQPLPEVLPKVKLDSITASFLKFYEKGLDVSETLTWRYADGDENVTLPWITSVVDGFSEGKAMLLLDGEQEWASEFPNVGAKYKNITVRVKADSVPNKKCRSESINATQVVSAIPHS